MALGFHCALLPRWARSKPKSELLPSQCHRRKTPQQLRSTVLEGFAERAGFSRRLCENRSVSGDPLFSSPGKRPAVRPHNAWRAAMSPRLAAVLEQVRRFAVSLHGSASGFLPLFERAFSDNPDRASTAIPQLARQFDAALAAIARGFFWIRQGELFQARVELESATSSGKTQSFWGGMAVLTLGEVCLELGEAEHGLGLIRRARQILGITD